MNQSSWRAKRSNPVHNLLLALLILISFSLSIEARTLNFSKRKIKDISNLKVREGVTKLNLKQNKITEISSLELPTTLEVLNIARNQITDLNLLELNQGLEALIAFDNDITTVNGLVLPDSLEFVTLSGNNISDISLLQMPDALEQFYCSDCGLTDETINGLVLAANLDTLSLSSNELTSLDGIQFNDSITTLFLLNNNFKEMDWGSIPDSIERLYFGGNFDVTNFSEMVLPPNLKVFELGVIFFDNPSFLNGKLPDSLTFLALRINFIESLEGFEIPPNLEELDLRRNSLTDFDYDLPDTMQLLDLRHNPIRKRQRRAIRARYKDMPNLKIKF